jgi:hypothetical protein
MSFKTHFFSKILANFYLLFIFLWKLIIFRTFFYTLVIGTIFAIILWFALLIQYLYRDDAKNTEDSNVYDNLTSQEPIADELLSDASRKIREILKKHDDLAEPIVFTLPKEGVIKNKSHHYINKYNPYSKTSDAFKYKCISEVESIIKEDRSCKITSFDKKTELCLKCMEPYYKKYCTPLEWTKFQKNFREDRQVLKYLIKYNHISDGTEESLRAVDRKMWIYSDEDINEEAKKTFFERYLEEFTIEQLGPFFFYFRIVSLILIVLLYIYSCICIYKVYCNDLKTSLVYQYLRFNVRLFLGVIGCIFGARFLVYIIRSIF